MANEQLEMRRQIALKVESTSGTAESLTSSELVRVIDPNISFQPIQNERNFAREYFTMAPDILGGDDTNFATLATITFGMEMTGHPDGIGSGNAPAIGEAFRGCGMAQVANVTQLVISGSITGGPFQHNEVVTDGSNIGTVIGDTWDGENRLRIVPTTGSGASGTWTGATSGASVSISSSVADGGYSWVPITDVGDTTNNKSLTIGMWADGTNWVVRGCRGTWSMNPNWGNRTVVNFTFTGILSSKGNTENFSSPSYSWRVPPTFKGASFEITATDGDSYGATAQFNNISFDWGNNVVAREDVNESDAYQHPIITNRQATGSINPDLVKTTTYDWLEHWYAGRTARIEFLIGSTAGNRFYIKAPAIQCTALSLGSRDEISTLEHPFKLTGGLHSGSTDDQLGANNEFSIHYY